MGVEKKDKEVYRTAGQDRDLWSGEFLIEGKHTVVVTQLGMM